MVIMVGRFDFTGDGPKYSPTIRTGGKGMEGGRKELEIKDGSVSFGSLHELRYVP